MSLKTIRESYSKFLTTLDKGGVKLTEAQKENLDTFILAIESKMSKQKEAAIKATKKVVTEHLEKEFRKAFESLFAHMQENSMLTAKIQDKVTKIKESKKIANTVHNYLDMYVESIIPEKKIIDYDRMQKLEKLHESLKDLLVANEDAVLEKQKELKESFDADKKKLETQIAKLKVELNESMDKNLKLNKRIDAVKARELLESKIKDLPTYEARQMRKRLGEATTIEIEQKFDRILESVKKEIEETEKEDEMTIESEVKDIIEAEENVKEDDLLKGRKHNLHVDEAEDDDDDEEEEEEVAVTIDDDNEDDVELDESEVIDAELMKMWCSQASKINTSGR